MKIPSLLLKRLYTYGSLENTEDGVSFAIKNRLSDATFAGLNHLKLNGEDISIESVRLDFGEGGKSVAELGDAHPFPLKQVVVISIKGHPTLDRGKHAIDISVATNEFGKLAFKTTDSIEDRDSLKTDRVPLDKEDNYSDEIIKKRQRYIEERSGIKLEHTAQYSFEPQITNGNIENFTGVAQIPLGFAGPLKVNGEYAIGDFIVPMATTEGTLVASYNRGIKVLNLSGGTTTTVLDDCMQRAPVFIFPNARGAREFRDWVNDNMDPIRREAESTSSVAKLIYIDTFLSNHFAYLRFNFSTGDAAGQNMVGRATFAACSWILENNDTIERFYLESNLATDKKASQVNIMRTRGKRVVAECLVKRKILVDVMRVEPESLAYHGQVANIGAMLSGANNNGAHSPNAITAIFIATGQDVANVSESSAGICYTELRPDPENDNKNDLLISMTIPSLIVATYGGGTGLPTQRECLEVMGCYGKGGVKKFAEIIAATVLAGELSLASAISSLEWVSSHESYGRNR